MSRTTAVPASRPIIERAWRYPERVVDCSLADWDQIVHQARRVLLLAELQHRFAARGLIANIPAAPRRHLEAARILADKHRLDVLQELRFIDAALAPLDLQPVILKGAAYVARGIALARGRVFSDVDVLIPQTALARAEQALRNAGWLMQGVSAYDEKYYRTWMHQLPPMMHIKRATDIDVHHTILPLTSREQLDPTQLFAAAVPLDGDLANFRTLSPQDMLLHSAAHLFHEGEFDHGLRDLVDLDYLFRDVCECDPSLDTLLDRAAELDLQQSLYYAAHFTRKILGTELPHAFCVRLESVARTDSWRRYMDRLFSCAFTPRHPSCDSLRANLARTALYVRGHYLRMPVHLLLPHLLRKSFQPNP